MYAAAYSGLDFANPHSRVRTPAKHYAQVQQPPEPHMGNRWKDIAAAACGLTDLRLAEFRAHYSSLFFQESSQGEFVLSCSPFQADRINWHLTIFLTVPLSRA